jgi:putative endonuclease
MHFVYIIKSKSKDQKYIGMTANLKRRILEHNSNGNKFTTRNKDYYLVWFCCFKHKQIAYNFEKYLKSSSGYAFQKKHLLL